MIKAHIHIVMPQSAFSADVVLSIVLEAVMASIYPKGNVKCVVDMQLNTLARHSDKKMDIEIIFVAIDWCINVDDETNSDVYSHIVHQLADRTTIPIDSLILATSRFPPLRVRSGLAGASFFRSGQAAAFAYICHGKGANM